MTFDEIEMAIMRKAYAVWLKGAGIDREWLRHAHEHGIAIEHARALADGLEGDLPVSAWPKVLHPPKLLHKRLRPASINGNMDIEHRLRISEGSGKTDEAFRKAIRAKNFTQNKLAKAIGVNQAVLSLHRQKLRKIPLGRAKAIERLTGWPADSKHWPCGFVTDGE